MNWAGFGIFILSVCLSTVIIVCNKFIKKVTNCYFFWLPIALFCFLWIFCWRIGPCWHTYMDALINNKLNRPSDYGQSRIISNAFLFQSCYFFSLAVPLSLIFDPSRKVAKLFAPPAIVGALMTLPQLMSTSSATFTLYYIFIGAAHNRCFVFYHLSGLLLSLGVLCNSSKFDSRGLIGVLVCLGIYFIYVLSGSALSGCKWSCSGLVINDYKQGGVYYDERLFLEKIISGSIPDAACPFIGTTITVGFNLLVILLNDKVFKHFKWFKYGNARNEKPIVWNFKKKTITLPWWVCWYDYNSFVVVEPLGKTIKNWFKKKKTNKKQL